jgi:WD40 repeat protein
MKKVKVIIKGKTEKGHEYDIKKSKKKNGDIVYTLSYSKNDKIWTSLANGKTILTCTEDMENFVLKFKFNEKFDFANFGHDQAFCMHIILKYIHRKDKAPKIKFK